MSQKHAFWHNFSDKIINKAATFALSKEKYKNIPSNKYFFSLNFQSHQN
jgi:hypothetical protein